MRALKAVPRLPYVQVSACCAATVAKKLYIKTYGCQMNVYDSDRMAHAGR